MVAEGRFHGGRHAGMLVPLFSIPSARSWGIGEITDLRVLANWAAAAGLDFVQLLPLNEMAEGQNSPYSALSAMATDPIFISLGELEDFIALGGEAGLDASSARLLASVRTAPAVDYPSVRFLKGAALWAAFNRFHAVEWSVSPRTGRAGAFGAYTEDQSWWLADYALFRALHARASGTPWMEWEEGLRARDPAALARARAELWTPILYYQYLQWIADRQLQDARQAMGTVGLFGDFPFMVSVDSADVWIHQEKFRFDASVGTPPDAFSQTGQDWGFPAYRWDVLERHDYDWLRQRARRSADLYDGYRIDHVVGFYRTYVRPKDGSSPFFAPSRRSTQLKLGERLMRIFGSAGRRIIAEDLGTVPDFVRGSLARMGVAGYRVLRWEREWKEQGQPFRDPAAYPAASVATTGTHDTDPLACWWDAAPAEERAPLGQIPGLRHLGRELATQPFSPAIRDAILELLYGSGSELLILPVQDIFGWPDRINTPGQLLDENWTYRLPWPVDRLPEEPQAMERAATLRDWSTRYGRALPATG